jgi:autoaggregation protein RapA/B/C
MLSVPALAIPISTNLVNVSNAPWAGSAYDSSSGKFYKSNGYGIRNSHQLFVYDNRASFEANLHSSVLTLQNGTFGTYFEVNNGKVYSRSDSNTSSISVWDASTGLKEASNSVPSMGGANGSHTFNWGGYSGVNFMEDQGNLYLVGKNASGLGWQVNKMDDSLNVLSTTGYNKNTLGYAFIINNILFSSDSFANNHINSALDLSTGTQSAVDFSLEGLGTTYITNLNYVGDNDTLYIHDQSGGELFKVDNASSAFGVGSVTVPVSEPGTFMLFMLGLAGLGLSRRNRMLNA